MTTHSRVVLADADPFVVLQRSSSSTDNGNGGDKVRFDIFLKACV